jgi:hypothetical protein
MAKRNKPINMPAPYLRRVWLDPSDIADRAAYPFCLPFLQDEFELSFDRPITIIVGENGTGKSTLLEGIAVLAGYDEAGGGRVIGQSIIPTHWRRWAAASRLHFAQAGCPGSPTAGSSAPRAFSRSQGTWTRRPGMTHLAHPRRTSSRIRTAKVFYVSSKCAAGNKASSSSTSRNRRYRPRARWNF